MSDRFRIATVRLWMLLRLAVDHARRRIAATVPACPEFARIAWAAPAQKTPLVPNASIQPREER